MNYQKLMAMAFSGIGALVIVHGAIVLISEGQVEVGLAIMGTGSTLLGTILGFAIGEANGIKKTNKDYEYLLKAERPFTDRELKGNEVA